MTVAPGIEAMPLLFDEGLGTDVIVAISVGAVFALLVTAVLCWKVKTFYNIPSV